MAIGGAVLTLLLYLAGFHDSVEKLSAAQWTGALGGLAIGLACLALAMREKRAQHPPEADWGYSSALGGGVLTALWGSVFGLGFAYAYFGLINPGFSDLIYQSQVAALEAKGLSAAQIEKIEPMMRKWMSPVAMTLMQGFMGFVWSLLLSLILAAFFRKRPELSESLARPPELR